MALRFASPPIGGLLVSNFRKCQPEVAGDVNSGLAVECVSADILAKFGDSRLTNVRGMPLFGRPDPFDALL